MTGLADCNNFFVSCERTVDPRLEGRPVVVLSNNDGCVVARSNEAKRLGIRMGQPAFEIRDLTQSGKVIALSGNHALYRDISIKVHAILRRYAPATLDYSVDEAFLDMRGIPDSSLEEIGTAIWTACRAEAGIPVTVGFAPTKTLAKLVTETCKKSGKPTGVLTDSAVKWKMFDSMEIRELWGIGRRLAKRLYQNGIYTIGDFARRERLDIRRMLGVNGEKTWLELHDVDCITLEHTSRMLQDSISETRTFPHDVDDYEYIHARIAIYTAHCAQKLRAMRGACSSVSVFLTTNRFHTEYGYEAPHISVRLETPADDTVVLVKNAVAALNKIYRSGMKYKRAGVVLADIVDSRSVVPSLFDQPEMGITPMPDKLKKVIDSLNQSGKIKSAGAVKLASELTVHHKGNDDGFCISFGSLEHPYAQKKYPNS